MIRYIKNKSFSYNVISSHKNQEFIKKMLGIPYLKLK